MREAHPSNSSQGFTYPWISKAQLQGCSKQVHDTTYKSMVQPTMEYASRSWDPYKVEDVNSLDKVQCHAACYACNNYTEQNPGCITAMVNSLGWESLQDCRKIHCLTMLSKSTDQAYLVEIPESESIIRFNNSRTLGSQRLFVPYTNFTVYKIKMLFFPRTIQDWNKLPPTTTDVQTPQ